MKKLLLSFLTIILLSCSNSNSNEDQNVPVGFLKQVTISGMGGSSISNYFYKENKIFKITSDYNTRKFIYTGDLITEIDDFDSDSNLISKTTYQYNSNNDIFSCLSLNYEHTYGFRSEITYNSDGTILLNNYSGDLNSQNTFISSVSYILENDEIINAEATYDTYSVTSNYEYDSSNTPMSQVIGFNKLNVLQFYGHNLLPFLFNGIIHNCTKVTNEGPNIDCPIVEYLISYNSNNCPEWLSINDGLNSCSDLPSFHLVYQ